MAARGSPATKKPKCDPFDLTRLPDAELTAQIEALDAEQRAADAAFKTQIQAIDAKRTPLKDELRRRQHAKAATERQKAATELQRMFDAGEISCMDCEDKSSCACGRMKGCLQCNDATGGGGLFQCGTGGCGGGMGFCDVLLCERCPVGGHCDNCGTVCKDHNVIRIEDANPICLQMCWENRGQKQCEECLENGSGWYDM